MKFYDILGQEITDLDNVFVHLHGINGIHEANVFCNEYLKVIIRGGGVKFYDKNDASKYIIKTSCIKRGDSIHSDRLGNSLKKGDSVVFFHFQHSGLHKGKMKNETHIEYTIKGVTEIKLINKDYIINVNQVYKKHPELLL